PVLWSVARRPPAPRLLLPVTLPPPTSPLFPYTTLFRSRHCANKVGILRQIIGKNTAQAQQRFHAVCALILRVDLLELRQHRVDQDRKSTTSELQSRFDLVCRLLLEKKK